MPVLAPLKEKKQNAFAWLDKPGLGWVFSGLSGYNDVKARQGYRTFLAGFDGPKALHLCANLNLSYLLDLSTELLSFNTYQIELMPKGYAKGIILLDKALPMSRGNGSNQTGFLYLNYTAEPINPHPTQATAD